MSLALVHCKRKLFRFLVCALTQLAVLTAATRVRGEPSTVDPSPTQATADQATAEPVRARTEDVRIAPLIGFGLPNLFNFGGLLKITPYLGMGINVGFIPTIRLTYYGQARVSYHEVDVYGRVFPFGGGFFLGSGFGYETAGATFTGNLNTSGYAHLLPPGTTLPNPFLYSSRANVGTWMLNPQVGYLYTSEVGFTIGFDIGVQIPISATRVNFQTQFTLPANISQPIADQVRTQLIDPTDTEVRNTLHSLGRTPIPTVNLRLGWFL